MKQPIRILVVDDEESILFALREYFTLLGSQVDCAKDRPEAEHLLATGEYSLVFLDLNLTGLQAKEGLELIPLVKQRSPQARIVMLTAYRTPAVEEEARSLGADDCFQKPISLRELADKTINRYFS